MTTTELRELATKIDDLKNKVGLSDKTYREVKEKIQQHLYWRTD